MVIDGLANIAEGETQFVQQTFNLVWAQGIEHDHNHGFARRRSGVMLL